MNELTTLERRALRRICTGAGNMLIVAGDQRNGMKAVMKSPVGPEAITKEELAAAKEDLVRFLGNEAPAILIDPEVALPQIIDDDVLASGTALVVGMDASGYETVDGQRYTRFVEGVTPRRVRELGGEAAKMLFYLRPDQEDSVARVSREIGELVEACAQEGLLLIVEILLYQLEDESAEEYAEMFGALVARAAEIAVSQGSKVLKLPYPGSAEACAEVTRSARGVPWAVLSAGVDHATFLGQVETAVTNGASGAMAGRSLWKDSLAMTSGEREQLLTNQALPRLRELSGTIDQAASHRA